MCIREGEEQRVSRVRIVKVDPSFFEYEVQKAVECRAGGYEACLLDSWLAVPEPILMKQEERVGDWDLDGSRYHYSGNKEV